MKWYNSQRPQKISTFTRVVIVVSTIFVGLGGVGYAALQSQQAKLTGNIIQTATANLQIGQDGNTYGDSLTGFSFSSLVPGGQAMPADGYTLYLKNAGGTPLALKLAISSAPLNPNNVDFTKVHVILTPTNGGSVQNFTLQSLIASNTTGGQTILAPGQLMPGTAQAYKLQVSMEVDAVTGMSATISNVDFSFSGNALSL